MSETAGEENEILSNSVYQRLKDRLMRAELTPHQRLKVRDLAREMGTSETPVREALVQLSREGAIEIKPRYHIRVRRLSYRDYEEIRDMRLALEAMAAEKALPHVTDADILALEEQHRQLIHAEETGDWQTALQANFHFHFDLYRKSGSVQLTGVLEGLWVRIGPLLSALYPNAKPTYVGPHQHENVLAALRARDAYALRMAIRQDLIEGGGRLVNHLKSLETREET
jgi:DNA-binding GntR family transcriptional regulator